MEMKRVELMPGVWLSHLRTDKFKTACLSLTMLTQLQRDTAAMNALIPCVLRRGTTRYRDMEALANRFDELYGSAIEPVVRRIGEIQCLGFYASMPEGDFIPDGGNILHDTAELMGQLLLSPATKGGLLLPEYVESEKEKLLDLIRSRINEKRGYAVFRCIEEMCCFEDFAVSRFGSESECEAIHYKKLTKHYRSLLQSSPIEIFYCGRASVKKVVSAMKEALTTLPRTEIDYDIGTDVRMNSVEETYREVTEEMDVTQGVLVMGFRLGECMEEPDLAAIYVFNGVFGSGSTSKLFMNVREKRSLCYYASSAVDTHKGLMFVSSGIAFDKLEEVKAEIFSQLEAVKRGEITEEELNSARSGIASDLRSIKDGQGELEGFYLANMLDGLELSPDELAELCENVSVEDVVAVANSVECDMIYFLTGSEDDEDEETEDAD